MILKSTLISDISDYQKLYQLTLELLSKGDYSKAIKYSGKMIEINDHLIDGYLLLSDALLAINHNNEAKIILNLASKYCHETEDKIQIQNKLDLINELLCKLPKDLLIYMRKSLSKDEIINLSRTSSFWYKLINANVYYARNNLHRLCSPFSPFNNSINTLVFHGKSLTKNLSNLLDYSIITKIVILKKTFHDILISCSKMTNIKILEFHLVNNLDIRFLMEILSFFPYLQVLKINNCHVFKGSNYHKEPNTIAIAITNTPFLHNLYHLEIIHTIVQQTNLFPACLFSFNTISKIKNLIHENFSLLEPVTRIKSSLENVIIKATKDIGNALSDTNLDKWLLKTLIYDLELLDNDINNSNNDRNENDNQYNINQPIYKNHLNHVMFTNLKALMIRNFNKPQKQLIQDMGTFNHLTMIILENAVIKLNAPNLNILCFSGTFPDWKWFKWIKNTCSRLDEIYIINQSYGIPKDLLNALLEWYLEETDDNDNNDCNDDDQKDKENKEIRNKKTKSKVLALTSPINIISPNLANQLKSKSPKNLLVLNRFKAIKMLEKRWSYLGGGFDAKFIFNIIESSGNA